MKKRFCLLLLLPALLVMAGCQPAPAIEPELSLADAAQRLLPAGDAFVSYTQEDLCDLTGISPDDYTEAVFLRDSDTLSGREVIMVRTKDAEAFGSVKDALERYLSQRLKETRDYLPNAYHLLSEARIQEAGLTVSLIIL